MRLQTQRVLLLVLHLMQQLGIQFLQCQQLLQGMEQHGVQAGSQQVLLQQQQQAQSCPESRRSPASAAVPQHQHRALPPAATPKAALAAMLQQR